MTDARPIQPTKTNTSPENGIVEVSGSNPLCSTRVYKGFSATDQPRVAVSSSSFEVFIPGEPGTAGSKKFVGISKKTGRAIIVDNSGKKGSNWRNVVAMTAAAAMAEQDFPPFAQGTPLVAFATFIMPRPQAHRNSKGRVKDTAPAWHTKKPDLTKMWRAAEDALKGVLWHDDGQVCCFRHAKIYGKRIGLRLIVRPANEFIPEET